MCSDHKSSMDNPTYDESISVTHTARRRVSNEEDERLFQNPLYLDIGHSSSNPPQTYEEIKMDTHNISTSSENVHGPGALSNEQFQNGGDIVSNSCYAALDHSTDYFTLEPHIPKPYQDQRQVPPSEDDYSQLHHK